MIARAILSCWLEGRAIDLQAELFTGASPFNPRKAPPGAMLRAWVAQIVADNDPTYPPYSERRALKLQVAALAGICGFTLLVFVWLLVWSIKAVASW